MNGRNSGIGSLRTWWQSRALHSDDAETRTRAVERLAEASDDRALAVLIETLDDLDPAVRTKTAQALGHVGSAVAIEPLVHRLRREKEHQVAFAIADALRALGPKLAVPFLLAALVEPDFRGRQNVASAARRICWDFLDDAGQARVAIVQNAWKEVAGLGPPAVEPLVQAIRREGNRTQREAADALGRMNDPVAAQALQDLLADAGFGTSGREIVAWALRTYYNSEVDDVYRARIAIVEGDWPRVISFAESAVPPLKDALLDQDRNVRQHAAEALVQIGGPKAAAVLSETLGNVDEGVDVREIAAQALGAIPEPRAVRALVGALRDQGWKVRKAAAMALIELEWTAENPTDKALALVARECWEQAVDVGEPAVVALLDALKYRSVSPAAARALLRLGEPGLDALLSVLRDPSQPIGIREVVARSLAEIGDPRAIEPVLSMLGDRDMVVRQAAVWTLEKLGWTPTDDTQRALAAIAHEDWDDLGRIGAAAVEPLLVLAEAGMAPQETVGALQQVLESSAERLSVEELQALSSLEDIPIRRNFRFAHDGDGEASSNVVDCERVRDLARFELTNRGIMA